jgi:hypothetical protein
LKSLCQGKKKEEHDQSARRWKPKDGNAASEGEGRGQKRLSGNGERVRWGRNMQPGDNDNNQQDKEMFNEHGSPVTTITTRQRNVKKC